MATDHIITGTQVQGVKPYSATVIADASFCPDTRAGGWACWVSHQGPAVKKAGRFHRLPKNSTEAEAWALLNGIWYAARLGATHILGQSDCKMAMVSIERRKSYKGIPFEELVLRHVKGHSRRTEPRFYVNNWCDREARKVMRKWRNELNAYADY